MDSKNGASEQSTQKTRWEFVVRHRDEIAEELDRMAVEIPGPAREYLRSLSRWFHGPAEFESALNRPDVLAIGLSVMESREQIDSAGDDRELRHAVRVGFLDSSFGLIGGRRLFSWMLYPILISLAALLLLIVFSLTIAPQFQEMFAEFGIELPHLTILVLGTCQFVQNWWPGLVLIPVLIGVLGLLSKFVGRDSRTGNISWIDRHLMSNRNACANWLWHVALLLDFGLSQDFAVSRASEASGNPWLKKIGQRALPKNAPPSTSPEPQLLFYRRYALASQALKLAPSNGKVAMLREVATFYWDRNRYVGEWWVQWLNAFILWMVGLLVVIAIASLFLPLIAIVSGLTGGRLF